MRKQDFYKYLHHFICSKFTEKQFALYPYAQRVRYRYSRHDKLEQ